MTKKEVIGNFRYENRHFLRKIVIQKSWSAKKKIPSPKLGARSPPLTYLCTQGGLLLQVIHKLSVNQPIRC